METKNIVATLYLKNGKAVKSTTDFTEIEDVYQLCQMDNDSGIDKIMILNPNFFKLLIKSITLLLGV